MLPSVSLPCVAIFRASGISPMPTLSSTIQITRLKFHCSLRPRAALDALGKAFDEALRQEAVHSAGDAALLVENDGGGDRR